MPKAKDILIHVKVETAIRKRRCHGFRCANGIAGGQKALMVRVNPAPATWHNYCVTHGNHLLALAQGRLNELQTDLS
jgi:hypothetical protein